MTADVRVLGTHEEMSAAAAAEIVAFINEMPDALILPATGRTPMLTYEFVSRQLVRSDSLRVAQLDDYVGVARSDRRSLLAWLERSVLTPFGVTADRVIALDGLAPDLDEMCRRHDAAIEAGGGVDLAILGIGTTGHLGFNEPPSGSNTPTRTVRLSSESMESSASYFDGMVVPQLAVTTGMSAIMQARRVLVLASGRHKAPIVGRTLQRQPTESVPSSLLRDSSGQVSFILDADAASEIGDRPGNCAENNSVGTTRHPTPSEE